MQSPKTGQARRPLARKTSTRNTARRLLPVRAAKGGPWPPAQAPAPPPSKTEPRASPPRAPPLAQDESASAELKALQAELAVAQAELEWALQSPERRRAKLEAEARAQVDVLQKRIAALRSLGVRV